MRNERVTYCVDKTYASPPRFFFCNQLGVSWIRGIFYGWFLTVFSPVFLSQPLFYGLFKGSIVVCHLMLTFVTFQHPATLSLCGFIVRGHQDVVQQPRWHDFYMKPEDEARAHRVELVKMDFCPRALIFFMFVVQLFLLRRLWLSSSNCLIVIRVFLFPRVKDGLTIKLFN